MEGMADWPVSDKKLTAHRNLKLGFYKNPWDTNA